MGNLSGLEKKGANHSKDAGLLDVCRVSMNFIHVCKASGWHTVRSCGGRKQEQEVGNSPHGWQGVNGFQGICEQRPAVAKRSYR